MRRRRSLVFWLVLVLIFAAGCAKREVTKKEEPLFPKPAEQGPPYADVYPAPQPPVLPEYARKRPPFLSLEESPKAAEPRDQPVEMAAPEPTGEEPQVNVLEPGRTGTAGPAPPSARRPAANRYSMAVIDRIVAGFDWGSFAFRYYSSVRIEDPASLVVLKLSKKAGEQELRGTLATGAGGERTETGALRLSNRIQATLTSADFDITSLSPETQLISSTDTFEWQWQIKPRHHGSGTLHLSVNALLDEGPYSLRTLDKTVRISVGTGTRAQAAIKSNWEYLKWAWGAILVPVVGYFWKRGSKSSTA